MKLPLFIAKRYLVSKKSHNAINIISLVSVLSIAVGTTALIVVLSAFNGLSDLVRTLYNSFDPDLEVTVVEGKTFVLNEDLVSKIKEINGVAYVSQTLEENALIKYKDQQCIATIKGVSENYGMMTRFDTLVRNGEYVLKEKDQHFAVVGKGIAYLLELEYMDFFSPMSIYVPKRGKKTNSLNPDEAFNEKKTLASGVFSINDDFDFRYLLLDLDYVRELIDKPGEVSALEVGLKKTADIKGIQRQIQALMGDKYQVKNKDQQNEVLFKTLESEKLWTFIILVFILIIATFNVIGSLTMLMIEKKKDIGILSDMGANESLLRKIFFWEGMLITGVGTLAGIVLGLGLCFLQLKHGFVKFNEGYVVDNYPVSIEATDVLLVIATVMLIGAFAAWYPVKLFIKRTVVLRN